MNQMPIADPEGDALGKPSRRDFLNQVLAAGGVIWVAGTLIPAGVYLWPAKDRGPGAEYVDAGSTADFPVGSERMVQKGGKPVMVLRLKQDEYRAFSAVCTHLACVVRWDRQRRQIRCPCHAGFFAADGTVISGPPPRPLTAYRVQIIDEQVRVYG